MIAQKTIKTKEKDTLITKIEILNQVKPLVLIPKMEVMTTKMIADYFEVEQDAIRKCYQRNKEKFIQDGVIKKKPDDFLILATDNILSSDSITNFPTYVSFKYNNYIITISNSGTLCFPKKAIIRMSLLLQESEIAKNIKEQLVDMVDINNKSNINIEDLTNKNAIQTRNKLIGRTEVLEKVKRLLLIPTMEVMTTKMVADYFEVEHNAIKKCYQRNKEEFAQDGVIKKTISDFNNLFNERVTLYPSYQKNATHISLQYNDNYIVTIPNCGVLCFPKRAVLRMGMLLTESEIAREIRTQLLNIVEKIDDKTKIEEIDKEQELCSKIGMAFLSGDINKIMIATTEAMNYKNRYINQLKNEQVKLSQINERLKTENDLLTKQTLKWGNKAVLNALIRKLSFVKDNGLVGQTWNSFYKNVKYKFGYDIKNRVGKGSYINKIKEKEFPNIISLAVSICKKNNIDVNKVINEININNYNK